MKTYDIIYSVVMIWYIRLNCNHMLYYISMYTYDIYCSRVLILNIILNNSSWLIWKWIYLSIYAARFSSLIEGIRSLFFRRLCGLAFIPRLTSTLDHLSSTLFDAHVVHGNAIYVIGYVPQMRITVTKFASMGYPFHDCCFVASNWVNDIDPTSC